MGKTRAAADELLQAPQQHLEALQKQWLRGPGLAGRCLRRIGYTVNWSVMRSLFRLRVVGREHVNVAQQVIFTPNHTSSLDPPAIAAALPYCVIRKTFWAGRKAATIAHPLRRALSRVAQAVPVDRNLTALAVGAAVLRRGHNLVWFPEGSRSQSGELGEFKQGIGLLLKEFQIPAVPVRIDGARAAMPPPGMRLQSLHRIRVTLGQPVCAKQLDADCDPQRIADALRQRLEKLQVEKSLC